MSLLIDMLFYLVNGFCHRTIAALFLHSLQTGQNPINKKALFVFDIFNFLILLSLFEIPSVYCKKG